MNLKRKLQIVEQAITSISTHSDYDAKLVDAALDRCAQLVQRERDELRARTDESIERLLGSAEQRDGA